MKSGNHRLPDRANLVWLAGAAAVWAGVVVGVELRPAVWPLAVLLVGAFGLRGQLGVRRGFVVSGGGVGRRAGAGDVIGWVGCGDEGVKSGNHRLPDRASLVWLVGAAAVWAGVVVGVELRSAVWPLAVLLVGVFGLRGRFGVRRGFVVGGGGAERAMLGNHRLPGQSDLVWLVGVAAVWAGVVVGVELRLAVWPLAVLLVGVLLVGRSAGFCCGRGRCWAAGGGGRYYRAGWVWGCGGG